MSDDSIEFYDVKNRKSVKVDLKKVTKTTYERTLKSGGTQTRYAFRGTLEDGRNVTKFCTKDQWEKASVSQS